MPTDLSLTERMDAEFAAANKRISEQQRQRVDQFQQRQERLTALDKTFDDLRDIWRRRFEALAKRFADRVKVTPNIAIGSRRATFDFHSDLAHISLRFSVLADEDVRNVIFQYDLEILPVYMKFDSHSELRFPLENIDREALARWIDERIISFVKTYLALHENNDYLQDHLVEDPIAKVRFPNFAAAATLDWQGQTIYFIGDETRRQFEQQENSRAK